MLLRPGQLGRVGSSRGKRPVPILPSTPMFQRTAFFQTPFFGASA